jgi:catechol 2,3-dioxygenase-like lactoylglutathione lyase family enzyme
MACLTAGTAVFAQAPRETPLGTGAQVTLHCQSPKSTGEFLHELGFRPVGSDEVRRTGRNQLSDGVLTVGLVQGHPRLPVLTYTAPDMERRAQALKEVVSHLVIRKDRDGRFLEATFQDPNGQPVLLTDRPLESSRAGGSSWARCGSFGEYSIPTKDLETSVLFWTRLGFRVVDRHEEPYPFAILQDGFLTLGLHKTTEFRKPAVTYFAPDMIRRIEALKLESRIDKFVDMHNRKGKLEGAQIMSPDGQPFFLFTEGG